MTTVDRVPLGEWPTPVERFAVPAVERELWVKRDDLSSGFYGGNKVRKLEFLLAVGEGPVVTVGARGSHHVLATAVHAARLGRPCVGVLVPQPRTKHVDRVFALCEERCASLVRLPSPISIAYNLLPAAVTVGRGMAVGRGASFIGPGGSSPAGILGYVNCGLELASQIRAGDCPAPTEVYVPLGTGGTAVGLALGLALARMDTRVVAVRVASVLAGNRAHLMRLAGRTFDLIHESSRPQVMPPLNLVLDHRWVGGGYGHVTEAGQDAQRRVTGLSLETTYTGKTMAALLRATGASPRGGPVLFLDTYGSIDDLN